MLTVDLNADVAEFDNNTNFALLNVVSSANVACGVHSGDPLLMHRTIERAQMLGTITGAHPSYPDRADFGRKSMFVSDDRAPGTQPEFTAKAQVNARELAAVIGAQLATYASLTGGHIAYLKPHGALYNDAQVNEEIATIIARETLDYGAAVVGQPGSQMQQVCERMGITYIAEVFADRGYEHNGRLIRRGLSKSEFSNPSVIARRAVQMVTRGTVDSYGFEHGAGPDGVGAYTDGTYTFSKVDTICLHGDTRGAYDIALAVREALEAAGVTIASSLAVTR